VRGRRSGGAAQAILTRGDFVSGRNLLLALFQPPRRRYDHRQLRWPEHPTDVYCAAVFGREQ
jgi:hypothetical protein